MDPPQLTELPDACLQLVMRGLDARDQLAAGAACSRLRSAASAALSAVAVPRATQPRLDSVTAYASRHGQHISRLDLGATSHALSLPPALLAACPRLRALRLESFVLPPGVLGTATGLSRLQLVFCADAARAEHSLAANVAAATGLAHLELLYCGPAPGNSLLLLPGSMLQALPHLTTLALQARASVDDGTLEHLSALTELRELELGSERVIAAGLEGLQRLSQLSSLRLLDCDGLAFSGPAVAQLSTLQVLEVTSASQFDPAALGAMRQLQRLVLDRTPVAAADTAALLQEVAGLEQLSHLDLDRTLRPSPAPAAAYAALTASANLAFLSVAGCELPEGVWQHAFRAGRRLPQLRELRAGSVYGDALMMSTSDVTRLAACCPALESLEAALQLGADLQPLAQLSALTFLAVTGVTGTTAAALRHASSSLQALRILHPHEVTRARLWLLVPLRQLTSLEVEGFNEDRDDDVMCYDPDPWYGPPGQVWQKLLDLCEERLLASEAEVAAHERQLLYVQEQLQDLQEDLQDAQRRLEEQQQGRAEAQAHLAELQPLPEEQWQAVQDAQQWPDEQWEEQAYTDVVGSPSSGGSY